MFYFRRVGKGYDLQKRQKQESTKNANQKYKGDFKNIGFRYEGLNEYIIEILGKHFTCF